MKTITIESENYGTYKAEYLTKVDYSKGVQNAGEITDLYFKYLGKSFFSKWTTDWPEFYPPMIKKAFPKMIEELYYPTEKSAPGHPLCNDKQVEKFKKELKKLKEKHHKIHKM